MLIKNKKVVAVVIDYEKVNLKKYRINLLVIIKKKQ